MGNHMMNQQQQQQQQQQQPGLPAHSQQSGLPNHVQPGSLPAHLSGGPPKPNHQFQPQVGLHCTLYVRYAAQCVVCSVDNS